MNTKQATLLGIIYEHNLLNGLWFVFVEFLFVVALTAFVATAEFFHHGYLLGSIATGIFLNGLTMLIIVSKQLKNGEPSKNLLQNRSRKYRNWVKKAHPMLLTHTTLLSLVLIIPLAIPITLRLQAHKITVKL